MLLWSLSFLFLFSLIFWIYWILLQIKITISFHSVSSFSNFWFFFFKKWIFMIISELSKSLALIFSFLSSTLILFWVSKDNKIIYYWLLSLLNSDLLRFLTSRSSSHSSLESISSTEKPLSRLVCWFWKEIWVQKSLLVFMTVWVCLFFTMNEFIKGLKDCNKLFGCDGTKLGCTISIFFSDKGVSISELGLERTVIWFFKKLIWSMISWFFHIGLETSYLVIIFFNNFSCNLAILKNHLDGKFS